MLTRFATRFALGTHLVLILLSPACHKEVTTQLHFKVQSNRGELIPEAVIKLDDHEIGTSNSQGEFTHALEVPLGQMSRIEVSKDSDSYYYAPYFEKIAFDGTTPAEVKIKAVLYFVPKPQLEQSTAKALASSDDMPLVAEAKNAPAAEKEEEEEEEAPSKLAESVNPALLPVPPPLPGPGNAASLAKAPDDPPPPAASPAGVASDQDQPQRRLLTAEEPDVVAPSSSEAARAAAELDAAMPSELTPALPATLPATPLAAAASPAAGEEEATAELAHGNDIALDAHQNEPASSDAALDNRQPEGVGRDEAAALLFTLHITDTKGPLPDTEVYLGRQEMGDLKPVCQSNRRGRCLIRLQDKPEGPLTLVVKKDHYLTYTTTTRLTHKGSLKIKLVQGQSLDIFAINKSYQHTRGLAGVDVLINGKKVGKTDQFGHYTYLFPGAADELLRIKLTSQHFLPEEFSSDFVATDGMSLVRYFSPANPPAVKITILETKVAGSGSSPLATASFPAMNQRLRQAAHKHLFASKAFREFPLSQLQQKLAGSSKTLSQISAKGWEGEALKGYVDALLQPTLVQEGEQSYLELSFIDSRGQVIAAADATLAVGAGSEAPIDQSFAAISHKIKRIFPFEGSVLSHKQGELTINIGSRHERALQKGDYLDIYATQVSSDGRRKEQLKTALARVERVDGDKARASLQSLAPRSVLSRGDMVVVRQNQLASPAGQPVLVVAINEKTADGLQLPLAQANLYFNEQWLGASNQDGRLALYDATLLKQSGQFKVVKHGFAMATAARPRPHERRLAIVLERQLAFLRVESHPSGATVVVDDRVLGKTPLASPLAVPSGFVKLEVKAPPGYKSLSRVLELDEGTLDLSGTAALQLEIDYLSLAARLLEAGKVQAAMAKLNDIGPEHSDYLLAQHELGEIYLNRLREPKQAAAKFATVTAQAEVRQYQDKRFISSHINEGIALFLAGEAEESKAPAVAVEYYQKALTILTNVEPYLRFIAKPDYERASHTVAYHNALALHRLWGLTREAATLQQAYKHWRAYLQNSPATGPEQSGGAYLENARVYYKQARAYLGDAAGKEKA